MRYSPEQKKATRQKILEAAHRGFRRLGFSGLGVDGLAKDAGVTSGAFYKHFRSKDDAFKESVAQGVGEFQAAVQLYQEKHGENWLEEFASFYLGEKRCAELGDSCALQSLTPEVTRANEPTRSAFQTALIKAARTFSDGLTNTSNDKVDTSTWSTLALLIGGVTLARAVNNPTLADEISDAIKDAILVQQETR